MPTWEFYSLANRQTYLLKHILHKSSKSIAQLLWPDLFVPLVVMSSSRWTSLKQQTRSLCSVSPVIGQSAIFWQCSLFQELLQVCGVLGQNGNYPGSKEAVHAVIQEIQKVQLRVSKHWNGRKGQHCCLSECKTFRWWQHHVRCSSFPFPLSSQVKKLFLQRKMWVPHVKKRDSVRT